MVHDMHAYGTLTTLTSHGYHICFASKFKDFIRHSKFLRKCSYCVNHSYHKIIHQYCLQKKTHLNGEEENKKALFPTTNE